MEIGTWISILIGLAGMFWLLSTACALAVEALSGMFNWRGRGLRIFISDMVDAQFSNTSGKLEDTAAQSAQEKLKVLSRTLYEHPLIRAYWKPTAGFRTKPTEPSYLPSTSFAAALIESICKEAGTGNGASFEQVKAALEKVRQAAESRADESKAAEAGGSVQPAKPDPLSKPVDPLLQFVKVREALEPLMAKAEGDIQALHKHLADWYDTVMERATGWYRRHTSFWIFWIALVLAALFNLNALDVVRTLFQNREARGIAEQLGLSIYSDPDRYRQALAQKGFVWASDRLPAMRRLSETHLEPAGGGWAGPTVDPVRLAKAAADARSLQPYFLVDPILLRVANPLEQKARPVLPTDSKTITELRSAQYRYRHTLHCNYSAVPPPDGSSCEDKPLSEASRTKLADAEKTLSEKDKSKETELVWSDKTKWVIADWLKLPGDAGADVKNPKVIDQVNAVCDKNGDVPQSTTYQDCRDRFWKNKDMVWHVGASEALNAFVRVSDQCLAGLLNRCDAESLNLKLADVRAQLDLARASAVGELDSVSELLSLFPQIGWNKGILAPAIDRSAPACKGETAKTDLHCIANTFLSAGTGSVVHLVLLVFLPLLFVQRSEKIAQFLADPVERGKMLRWLVPGALICLFPITPIGAGEPLWLVLTSWILICGLAGFLLARAVPRFSFQVMFSRATDSKYAMDAPSRFRPILCALIAALLLACAVLSVSDKGSGDSEKPAAGHTETVKDGKVKRSYVIGFLWDYKTRASESAQKSKTQASEPPKNSGNSWLAAKNVFWAALLLTVVLLALFYRSTEKASRKSFVPAIAFAMMLAVLCAVEASSIPGGVIALVLLALTTVPAWVTGSYVTWFLESIGNAPAVATAAAPVATTGSLVAATATPTKNPSIASTLMNLCVWMVSAVLLWQALSALSELLNAQTSNSLSHGPLQAVASSAGWFATAIGAAMGAPFWYGLIGRLANNRATGERPDPASPPSPQKG